MHEQEIPDRWRQHPFQAMGSHMTVWLDMENPRTAAELLHEAEAMFHSAERVLSRFDMDSELSRLNSQPERWTQVSDLMWSVISQALFMARETGGLFDPTQLTALESAGYDRSFVQMDPELISPNGEMAADRRDQWQKVQLDPVAQAVWLPSAVRLDLGGIAKGCTAQQVVDFLNETGPCLVDAGGDLTAGAAPLGWPGWPVSVSPPFQRTSPAAEDLFQLWLLDGSMATSGIDYRRWRRNGRLAHHVIDPRTGLPAETDLLTVTVLARAAARAEAWATAALVNGSAAAQQQLSALGLAAAMVDQHNNLTLTPALAPYVAPIAFRV